MDSRNKSEKFWDRTANHYDNEEKKDRQTNLNIIEKTRGYLKANDVVMDYGCGTGLVSNEIADNVKMVHAIDISSKMIEIAKNKTIRTKIQNIDYAHRTIFDKEYKSGSFDIIIAFHILHLLADPQKVVKKINDLLKPRGLLISATPCMGERPFLNRLFSIGSKLGVIPTIKSFKLLELEDLIITENFELVETGCLHQKSQQYFLIAKKI